MTNHSDIQQRNVVYCQAMIACAQAKIQGMVAENVRARYMNSPPLYGLNDFMSVIEEYGIHHNAVLTNLNNGLNY